jgi:hypothetical protein
MTTYLGIHDMGQAVPEEQMGSSWEAYKTACDKLGCSAQHVHFNARAGRAFCLTEATSADLVQKAHDEAGVPLVEVLEVQTAE